MIVLLFYPRFHGPIRAGTKRQTVRQRARPVQVGDVLSLRGWSGTPYRSPQIVLKTATVASRHSISVRVYRSGNELEITLDGVYLAAEQLDELACGDGFNGPGDMGRYYYDRAQAGKLTLPFEGVLIRW